MQNSTAGTCVLAHNDSLLTICKLTGEVPLLQCLSSGHAKAHNTHLAVCSIQPTTVTIAKALVACSILCESSHATSHSMQVTNKATEITTPPYRTGEFKVCSDFPKLAFEPLTRGLTVNHPQRNFCQNWQVPRCLDDWQKLGVRHSRGEMLKPAFAKMWN